MGKHFARVLAGVLAVLLVVSFTGIADAQSSKKKKRQYSSQQKKYVNRSNSGRVYSETDDPDTLPYGSTIWWRSMDFHGRGGFSRGP